MEDIIKRVWSIKPNQNKRKIEEANSFIVYYKKYLRKPAKPELDIEPLNLDPPDEKYTASIKEEILETNPWKLETKLLIWTLRKLDLLDYVFSVSESNIIRHKMKELMIIGDKDMMELYDLEI